MLPEGETLDTVMLEVDREQDRPEPEVVASKFTVPANPFIPVTTIVTVEEVPAFIVWFSVLAETVKSPTVSESTARWLVEPLVAFTITLYFPEAAVVGTVTVMGETTEAPADRLTVGPKRTVRPLLAGRITPDKSIVPAKPVLFRPTRKLVEEPAGTLALDGLVFTLKSPVTATANVTERTMEPDVPRIVTL